MDEDWVRWQLGVSEVTLSEFLDDFQIALGNGFGKVDSVIKMHKALLEITSFHQVNSINECDWCDIPYPCYEIKAIEAILNES